MPVRTERSEAELQEAQTQQAHQERGAPRVNPPSLARMFEGIASTTPDFLYVFDTTGRFLYANRRLLEVWGRELDDVVGKTCLELGYEKWHHDMHMREISEVIATRCSIKGEVPFTAPLTGTSGVYEYIFSPVIGEDGEVELIAGTTRDVSGRARAEAELSAARRRLDSALFAGEVGTFEWDVVNDQLWGDANFARLFGVELDSSGAAPLASYLAAIHPDDREPVTRLLERSLSGGEPYTAEYRIVQGEATRWVVARGKVERDAAGRPLRFPGVVLDVTERKALQAEREALLDAEQAARTRAEVESRIKDEFLATLSHELRTPLSAILGWSQLLSRSSTVDEEKLQQGIVAIERNARTQARLIEDLLDMSRIVSGKVRLAMQPVPLADVVSTALATVQPSAEARGVRLEKRLDPLTGPVSGDLDRLQQVIWNLLSNAVKFTPRGGKVEVALERKGSQVQLTVADTGEGIDPAFLPHVFDRFRQADGTTTRQHGGLGLGLSIVRHLVEMHGGTVRAESAGRGRGATFAVCLPVGPALGAAPQAAQEQRRRRDSVPHLPVGAQETDLTLSGVRVLLVDDDADGRELVRRVLEERGATVFEADSSSSALELLPRVQPTVLVSDIGMPGGDGYSLIRQVRALARGDAPKLPALALTAFARPEDRQRALATGFDMHMTKPVDPEKVVNGIAALAGKLAHSP